MEITWYGHSCFRVKGKEAVVILDPCSPGYGYTLPKLQADIVTVSHSHPGHNYVEAVTGTPRIIRGPGEYELKGVFMKGVATFHDAERGAQKGRNTVYVMEIDGIKLCHLGDLGHSPAPELIDEMSDVQVLMIPTGVISTLAIGTAIELVKNLSPKIVLPMHYKTPKSTRDLEPVEKFLKELGVKEAVPVPKLTVTRASLPLDMQVIILEPQA